MKLGVNTFIWSAEFNQSNFHLLPTIKEAGFDGVEVPLLRAKGFDASAIRRAIEANALECTVCTALTGGLSLISEDAEVRRNTRTHLRQIVETAGELGAKIVAGPAYSSVGYFSGRRRTTEEWKRAIEGIQSLGDVLVANDVTLAIEPLNRFETYFLNTAVDATALSEQIGHPNVGVLFDTFHANIEEKSIANGYRTVGSHLKHVHTCENDRGIPGSGHVDWKSVFQALHELEYDGWLTIESFGFALGDMSAAAAIWRDIEITPDSIAFEGVKFLKKRLTEFVDAPVRVG
jgi:D-psicose/D-tagatose/L-ribulose 3-epimerase